MASGHDSTERAPSGPRRWVLGLMGLGVVGAAALADQWYGRRLAAERAGELRREALALAACALGEAGVGDKDWVRGLRERLRLTRPGEAPLGPCAAVAERTEATRAALASTRHRRSGELAQGLGLATRALLGFPLDAPALELHRGADRLASALRTLAEGACEAAAREGLGGACFPPPAARALLPSQVVLDVPGELDERESAQGATARPAAWVATAGESDVSVRAAAAGRAWEARSVDGGQRFAVVELPGVERSAAGAAGASVGRSATGAAGASNAGAAGASVGRPGAKGEEPQEPHAVGVGRPGAEGEEPQEPHAVGVGRPGAKGEEPQETRAAGEDVPQEVEGGAKRVLLRSGRDARGVWWGRLAVVEGGAAREEGPALALPAGVEPVALGARALRVQGSWAAVGRRADGRGVLVHGGGEVSEAPEGELVGAFQEGGARLLLRRKAASGFVELAMVPAAGPKQAWESGVSTVVAYVSELSLLGDVERGCGLPQERFATALGVGKDDAVMVAASRRSVHAYRFHAAAGARYEPICGSCPPMALEARQDGLGLFVPVRRLLEPSRIDVPLAFERERSAASAVGACTASSLAVAYEAGGQILVQRREAESWRMGPPVVVAEADERGAPVEPALVGVGERLLLLWRRRGRMRVEALVLGPPEARTP